MREVRVTEYSIMAGYSIELRLACEFTQVRTGPSEVNGNSSTDTIHNGFRFSGTTSHTLRTQGHSSTKRFLMSADVLCFISTYN